MLHVLGNVESEDVVPVNLSIQRLLLVVVSGETFHRVRNVQTSVDSSLHGGEHLGSGRGPGKTNIQTTPEYKDKSRKRLI